MIFSNFNSNNQRPKSNKIIIHLNRFARYIIQNSGRIVILASLVFLSVLIYVLFFFRGTDFIFSSEEIPTLADYEKGVKHENKGDSLVSKDNFKAIQEFRLARNLLRADSSTVHRAQLSLKIGMAYAEEALNQEALDAYLEGQCKISQQDKRLNAEFDYQIASIYLNQQLLQEADKRILHAISFYEKNKTKYGQELSECYLNKCTIELNRSNVDGWLHYSSMASKIVDHNSDEYPKILLNIGSVYFQTNQIDSGLYLFQVAKPLLDKYKDSAGLAMYYGNISYVDFVQNRIPEAIVKVNKAIDYLPKRKTGNSFHNQIQTHRILDIYYETKGDYKSAYENNKALRGLVDSMYSIRSIKYIADVENNHKLKAKNEELEHVKLQKSVLNADIENKNQQKVILISLLILVFILGLYVYKILSNRLIKGELNHQILEKSNQVLEGKKALSEKKRELLEQEQNVLKLELNNIKQELEFNSHVIDKKEAMIHDLEEQIKAAFSNENEQQEIIQIIDSLKIGLREEKESLGIDIMLNEDNVKFLKKLKEKHNDISQTEARFCTLLYLNLDTKEIARILNITLDGVRKGRHRLRKKLGLEEAGDVSEYLQGI